MSLARTSADNIAAACAEMPALAWLEPGADLGDEARHLPCWQAMAELLLLKNEDRLRTTIDRNSGFPARSPLKQRWLAWRDDINQRAEAVELLYELRSLPAPVIDPEERLTISALARTLLLAAAQLRLLFAERGLVDHAEIAATSSRALRDSEAGDEFALRHTLRISHLLVDECQDTSPDQIDLVRDLTAGWQRGDRRSLFLVGDRSVLKASERRGSTVIKTQNADREVADAAVDANRGGSGHTAVGGADDRPGGRGRRLLRRQRRVRMRDRHRVAAEVAGCHHRRPGMRFVGWSKQGTEVGGLRRR